MLQLRLSRLAGCLERSKHLANNIRADVLRVPILALHKQIVGAFRGLDINAAIADPARC
jgi:hypothetical protein